MPTQGVSQPQGKSHKGPAAAVVVLVVGLWMGFEGLELIAGPDPVGIPTACYGHTGTDVRIGNRYTMAECRALLEGDIAEANATVHRCIHAPMLPHQEAAMTLFAGNVGPGKKGVKDGLCVLKSGKPTYISRMANAGRWAEACAGLDQWVTAKGIRLRGLVTRRAVERKLCEGTT